ncbi:MAG: GumC family protein, partial [Candidatus Bipolaricaulia bacterium]
MESVERDTLLNPHLRDDSPGEAGHLQDYWWILRKRLWLVLVIVGIAVVHTLVVTTREKPVYRATAQLLIQRDSPQVLKGKEVLALDALGRDYYPTQHRLLKSRALARGVIEQLGLDGHPEFNPESRRSLFPFNVREALASVVRTVIPRSGTPEGSADADDPLAPYIDAYLGMLRVEPVEDSRLVNISFEGHDAALVAQMANTHAQAYIDRDLEMKLSAAEEAVQWLSGRLDDLKGKLRESEEALQRFLEKEDIVALETILSASGGSEENLVARKLAELNLSSLTAARTERIRLETLHEQLSRLSERPGLAESIPQVIDNSLIQNLKSNYIALSQQYSELREKYGEKHLRMVALRREIGNLRSRIVAEVGKVAKSVELQYKMALAKERTLQEALEKAKGEAVGLNRKAIEYGVLKREVESNRQIYDMILRRAKETSLTSRLKSTNIFIVDRAEVPPVPIGPQVQKSVLIAAVIGLFVSVGLAFFLNFLDNTLHSPRDVERHLGVPFLGQVGQVTTGGGMRGAGLIALREPKSNVAESL